MKYKVLKSIAHNFSHQFLSGLYFIDDGYAVKDLLHLVRDGEDHRVSIQWIPDSIPEPAFPERIAQAIALQKEWLPNHIERAGGSIESIREFRTDVFLRRNRQIIAEARLVDDRGKQYVCTVLF